MSHAPALQRLAVELSLDADDLAAAHAWLEAYDRWASWSDSVVGQAESQLLWSGFYQQNIDAGWGNPLPIPTPPHPEYTSAHAVT